MKAKGLSMLLRDVDPDVAAHLPPEFVNRFLGEIDYCDQSESPPTKATQTHALLFSFHHTAPGHNHQHIYKGLLVYSPPIYTLSLGSFSGTGCLVAHPGQAPQVFQELGTSQRPSPWVRIGMTIQRTGSLDSATGFHKVFINVGFTFMDVTGLVLGAPARVERYVEGDLDIIQEFGESPGPPFMQLKNASEGDQGRIHFTRTTVVPS